MSAESIRVLIGAGVFMMLLFLRLESGRFGAAEYDEPGRPHSGLWTRLSWYLIGFALLAAIYVVHPAPHDVLFLLVGRRADVAFFGAILGLLGLAQAAAFALFALWPVPTGLTLSAEQALQALSTVRLVSFKVGDSSSRTGVSVGSPHARQVLKGLGIEQTKPPTPSKGEQVAV